MNVVRNLNQVHVWVPEINGKNWTCRASALDWPFNYRDLAQSKVVNHFWQGD